MKDLTKGNIPKNLFLYAIPAILSGVLSRTHSTVDSIMVGQFLGTNALAAIGSMSNFRTVLSSLLWGAGTGVALYIASLVSARKKEEAVRAIKSNITILLIITMIISIIALLLAKPIFKIFAVGLDIYQDAMIYYALLILSEFAIVGHHTISNIFLFTGSSKFAMYSSAISCVLNISLNYLFIKIIPLGVFGTGLATAISLVSVFAFAIYKIRKECRLLSDKKQPFNFNKEEISACCKLAVPCMIQQGIMYVSGAVISPSINGLDSSSAIAAYSVCTQLYNICTIFFYAASKGLLTITTQCYSSGKVNLIKRCFYISIMLSILYSIPVVGLALLFPNFIASLFVQEGDLLTAQYIVRYIALCFPFVVFAILNNCYHNFYRGLLKPNFSTFTTAIYTVARIIFTLLLIPSFQLDGAFYGFILSWMTEFIVCVIIHMSNKWKSPKYIEMEQALKTIS